MTREQRIYELENILDQQDIEEGDRLLVMASLERLRTTPDLDDSGQAKLWKSIRAKAPGLLGGVAKRTAESVMTAYVKAQLGL